MTAQEYRDTIARLGLSQSAAARLLGVKVRTSQRWADPDPVSGRDIPPPAARFLLWMVHTNATPADVHAALDGAS